MIQNNTRFQKGCVDACLDHIYTCNPEAMTRVFNQNVISTNHHLIGVRVLQKKPLFEPEYIKVQNIEKVEPEKFHQHMFQLNFQEIFLEDDPDRALQNLETKIHETLAQLAPEHGFQTSPHYAKWMTPILKAKVESEVNA